MATVRVPKGDAALSSLGSTLVVPGVTAKPGSFLEASVGYRNDQGPPVAHWGNSNMRRLSLRVFTAQNIAVAKFAKLSTRVSETKAKDVLLSWQDELGNPTSINARAMYVTAYEGITNPDGEPKNRTEAATTSPNTGLPDPPTIIGVTKTASFVSNGPVTDVQGTPTGATVIGQRAGTDSGSNDVTIEEYFDLDRPNVNAVQTIVNGTALRDWVMSQLYIKPSEGEIGVTDGAGGTDVLTPLEMGEVETAVLAWANANQATVQGWFPAGAASMAIQGKTKISGLAFSRMSDEVV